MGGAGEPLLVLPVLSPEYLRSGVPGEAVPGDEARLEEPPPREWLLELLLDRLARLAPVCGSGFAVFGGGGGATAAFGFGFSCLFFEELFLSYGREPSQDTRWES